MLPRSFVFWTSPCIPFLQSEEEEEEEEGEGEEEGEEEIRTGQHIPHLNSWPYH